MEKGTSIRQEQASRVFMVVERGNYLESLDGGQYSIFTQKFHHSVSKTLKHFEGQIINQDNNSYLVQFRSATNAVLCALEIEQKFKYVTPKFENGNRQLKIGLSTTYGRSGNAINYDDAIIQATQMCEVVKDRIVISPDVKALYEKENKNARIDARHIRTLKDREIVFLDRLMKVSQQFWNQGKLSLSHIRSSLGISRSSFYRQVKRLTGKSPNYFVREFRLHRALNLLHKRQGNISKIASATGFRLSLKSRRIATVPRPSMDTAGVNVNQSTFCTYG